MNSSMAAQFIQLYDDFDHSKHKDKLIEGKRYASNENQSYLLVKNMKNKEENIIFQSNLDDDCNLFKERRQTGIKDDHYKKLERKPAKFQVLTEKNALRKRLASESSDEMISVGYPKDKHREETKVSTTIKPDQVEFMSSSSDESSNEESRINSQQNNSPSQDIQILKEIANTNLNDESLPFNLTVESGNELPNKIIQTNNVVDLSNKNKKSISMGQKNEISVTELSTKVTIEEEDEKEPVKEDLLLFDNPSSPVLVEPPVEFISPTQSELISPIEDDTSPKEDLVSPPILSPANNEETGAFNQVLTRFYTFFRSSTRSYLFAQSFLIYFFPFLKFNYELQPFFSKLLRERRSK
jgi:hypothetical protein